MRALVAAVVLLMCVSAGAAEFASHEPMRPLPTPNDRPLPDGPKVFIDAAKGDDKNDGSEARPLRTLTHALTNAKPGDTLVMRAGTYYERVNAASQGAADKPITIRAYPGELAILDAGLREFFENPAEAWEPFEKGAPGEYRSVKAYPELAKPANPPRYVYVMGSFGDSMIPLHGYNLRMDMNWPDMYVGYESKFSQTGGMYCGPGVWFDARPITRDAYGSFRIHVRLAHTNFPVLGKKNYVGETDPRKLPLVISGPEPALTLKGANHVVVQDLVLRGARNGTLNVNDSEDITLDGLTVYGGAPALLLRGSKGVRLLNSALRGVSAPWSSRSAEKYRGVSTYLVMTGWGESPKSEDVEFANCEFTDCHDGLWLLGLKSLDLRHSLVDSFNDDGIEVGPKDPARRLLIHHNRISQALMPFALHGKYEDLPTVDGMGVFIYRNVVDQRETIHYGWPTKDGPQEINSHGWLVSDHGSPPWPAYHVYQNTIVMHGASWRGYYASGLARGTRGTRRRVFNNIFLHVDGVPGFRFPEAKEDFVADGQLQWSMPAAPDPADAAAAIRKANRGKSPAAWGAHDVVADPKFVSFKAERFEPNDLCLQADSPAVNAGVEVPKTYPDATRAEDRGAPDIGAFPLGAEVWRIGVRGRLSPFAETVQ